MHSVIRRTSGKTTKPVTAATGQPTIKAVSQRSTKSPRGPMLSKVTAALATKTMTAVARTGTCTSPCLASSSPRRSRFAFLRRRRDQIRLRRDMVNTRLHTRKHEIIEQSLTEILALSAHVAWRSVIFVWLPRRCRVDRGRRLQPQLLRRRTRGLATRRGGRLRKLRRRERRPGTGAHIGDQRAGHMRRGFSYPDLGVG